MKVLTMKPFFCIDNLRLAQAVRPLWFATARARRPQKGFTMIELMVTLAIAAILLGIGVPSFVGVVERNRVATEINALLGDLQYARGLAIKEGRQAVVCASANGTSCATASGTQWKNGWIVFSDIDKDGTFTSGDTVYRKQAAWTSTDVLTVSGGALKVAFDRDGFAHGLTSTGLTFTLTTASANEAASRCLSISRVGKTVVAGCAS